MDFSSKKTLDIAKNVLRVESKALQALSNDMPNCFVPFIESVYNCNRPSTVHFSN